MKKIIAILAAVMALALLIAACGPKPDVPADTEPSEEITTVTEAPVETTEDEITTTGSEETTTEEAATTTEPAGDTTAPAESSTEPTTAEVKTTKPDIPSGKKEILAAYTKVVDKVKIDMPEYKSNDWQTMSNVDMNRALYTVANTIARGFLETFEQSTVETHEAGRHHKWFALPTATHKVGCVLTDTSKIDSASCKKSGEYYEIKISLELEKDPVMNIDDPYACKSWHGRLFDVIDITEVTEYAKNFPTLNTDNSYCTFKGTATLKYDPVTNECVSLDHIIDVRIHLGAGEAKVIADYHFYDFKF